MQENAISMKRISLSTFKHLPLNYGIMHCIIFFSAWALYNAKDAYLFLTIFNVKFLLTFTLYMYISEDFCDQCCSHHGDGNRVPGRKCLPPLNPDFLVALTTGLAADPGLMVVDMNLEFSLVLPYIYIYGVYWVILEAPEYERPQKEFRPCVCVWQTLRN